MFEDNEDDLSWSRDLMDFYYSLSNTGKLVYLYDITVAEEEDLDEETDQFFNDFYENSLSVKYVPPNYQRDSVDRFRILGIRDNIFINYDDSIDYRKIIQPLIMNGLVVMSVRDMSWYKLAEEIKDQLVFTNIKAFKVIHPKSLIISVN